MRSGAAEAAVELALGSPRFAVGTAVEAKYQYGNFLMDLGSDLRSKMALEGLRPSLSNGSALPAAPQEAAAAAGFSAAWAGGPRGKAVVGWLLPMVRSLHLASSPLHLASSRIISQSPAFAAFCAHFREAIQDLIYSHPKGEADAKTGAKFWSGHKRFPNVAEWAPDAAGRAAAFDARQPPKTVELSGRS